MKFILGEKIGMTQIFDAEGSVSPVTVVLATPNVVTQVRTKEKDGYEAIQVGFGTRKEKNIAKPQKGHFKDLGSFMHVREFKGEGVTGARGDKIDVSVFKEGDMVKVSGISKSKGFQGVMKRHGFHGAPASHGTKHAHREPGSIGGGGGRAGGRVVLGMKMAGRMGGTRQTLIRVKVTKVDAEQNLIALRGAVPGRRGTLIEICG
ncbi:MAG: 50S ribosomal protein L3 [Candidatus Sungbacteria bacterium]|nr:50S ribosomal protein L3 [Candidatus Sungbacteria bacterium]